MAKFDNVFMRPNQSNNGEVPVTGGLCMSPDIWISGTSPMPGARKKLVTEEYYQKQSPAQIIVGHTNYIYVRCRNNTDHLVSCKVRLFYVPASILMSPSIWKDNELFSQSHATVRINNIKPGAIGVSDDVFRWQNVPPCDKSGDHYCMVAFLDDGKDSFDDIINSNRDTLFRSDLRWTQRNVTLIGSGNGQSTDDFSFNAALSIPKDLVSEGDNYVVSLTAAPDYAGCSMSFSCDKKDEDGKEIKGDSLDITEDNRTLACYCRLVAGFDGNVKVEVKNPSKKSISKNALISLEVSYCAAQSGIAAMQQKRMVLVEDDHNQRIHRALLAAAGAPEEPMHYIKLGGYHVQVI